MNALSRWKNAALGLLALVVCLALAAYYATAAHGHPRVKHILLFVGLAVISALFIWFTAPSNDSGGATD
ncbi:MAG TPA: hypothetical protein VH951_09915 [Dehalococcoidia bacterium]